MGSLNKKHEAETDEQELVVTGKGIYHAETARYIMSRRTFITISDTEEILVYRKKLGYSNTTWFNCSYKYQLYITKAS